MLNAKITVPLLWLGHSALVYGKDKMCQVWKIFEICSWFFFSQLSTVRSCIKDCKEGEVNTYLWESDFGKLSITDIHSYHSKRIVINTVEMALYTELFFSEIWLFWFMIFNRIRWLWAWVFSVLKRQQNLQLTWC